MILLILNNSPCKTHSTLSFLVRVECVLHGGDLVTTFNIVASTEQNENNNEMYLTQM